MRRINILLFVFVTTLVAFRANLITLNVPETDASQTISTASLLAQNAGAAVVVNAAATGLTFTPQWGQVLINKTILGSSQNGLTFSNIPQTYNQLQLVVVGRGDTASNRVEVHIQLGTGGGAVDSGGNYQYIQLYDTGGTLSYSHGESTAYMYVGQISAANSPSNTAGAVTVDFYGYNLATFYKTAQAKSGSTPRSTGILDYNTVAWKNTGAITSMYVFASAGNFITGTAFYLYGIV